MHAQFECNCKEWVTKAIEGVYSVSKNIRAKVMCDYKARNKK
jgi:hypothetical protein